MRKLILALAVVLGMAGEALGATTYNIGPGQTYTTFTLLVATETLTSDDIVDGGGNTFRETWTVDGSGTAGHVVTLRNATIYGSTADTGAAGWTGPDGNGEYYKTYATEPRIVLTSSGTILEKGTVGSLAATEWGYAATELYLGFNPATTNVEVGQRAGVDTNDKDYITISDITVKYTQRTDACPGAISLTDTSTNCIVDDCTIDKVEAHGILVKGLDTGTISNSTIGTVWCLPTEGAQRGDGIYIAKGTASSATITISGNTIGSGKDTIMRSAIIAVDGDDLTISANTIRGGRYGVEIEPPTGMEVGGTTTITGNDIQLIANTSARGGSNFHIGLSLIETETGAITGTVNVTDNTVDMTDSILGTNNGFRLQGLNNFTAINITNNSFLNTQHGFYVAGVLNGASATKIAGNLITGGAAYHQFGINFISSTIGTAIVTVANNIIKDFTYGVDFNDTTATVEADILNNTIDLLGTEFGIRVTNVVGNDADIRNNVFAYTPVSGKRYVAKSGANPTFACDYNYYKETGTYWAYEGAAETWAEWQVSGNDAHGRATDPLLNADFTLQPLSPCINTGTTIAAVTDDILGTARPQAGLYDIGAYEKAFAGGELDPGAGTTTTLAIVTSGSWMTIDNTGTTTQQSTIVGPVNISENATATNTIFAGPVILLGDTLTATNCAFAQSEAEIEALGGTVTDTNCLFSTDSRLRRPTGDRWWHFMPSNRLVYNAGTAIGGVTTDYRGLGFIGGVPIGAVDYRTRDDD